jgi:hypothetical protein
LTALLSYFDSTAFGRVVEVSNNQNVRGDNMITSLNVADVKKGKGVSVKHLQALDFRKSLYKRKLNLKGNATSLSI